MTCHSGPDAKHANNEYSCVHIRTNEPLRLRTAQTMYVLGHGGFPTDVGADGMRIVVDSMIATIWEL